MSALKQFRHKGGFRQLLQVLEISDSAKQKGLLQLIALEDPGWAHLLKLKIMTVERILSWAPPFLQQALVPIPVETLFQLYAGCGESQRKQIDMAVPPDFRRDLRERLNRESPPTSQAVFMAGVKLIQTVRELENMGTLDLEQVDPSLCWEPDLVA